MLDETQQQAAPIFHSHGSAGQGDEQEAHPKRQAAIVLMAMGVLWMQQSGGKILKMVRMTG